MVDYPGSTGFDQDDKTAVLYTIEWNVGIAVMSLSAVLLVMHTVRYVYLKCRQS